MITESANAAINGWLAGETPETVLDPELPIVDPHHHLWDIRRADTEPLASFQQKVYLCEDITTDISNAGHNVVQTVFAQCGAFYRADGPEEMRCVGETEFVHGIAAMSRSGLYGSTRLCTGIFGAADLRPGRIAEPVLVAHMDASPNFRGIRSAFPGDLNAGFLEGFALLGKYELSFDNYGEPTFSTATTKIRARIVYKPTVVLDFLGEEVIANITAWVASTSDLATTSQYTLPDDSTPPLVSISRYPDEDGLHHQVLHFGAK